MPLNTLDVTASTILIVDDEERNLRIFSKWLEDEGYECCLAASGGTALTMAYSIEPDLIILDLMMPGMDGFQVAEKLKSNEKTAEIPIIIATALDDKKSLIRGLSKGAEEFLTKPVDSNELLVRVRNLLRLKKASDLIKNHAEELENRVKQRTKSLKQSFMETISILGKAADYRDDETGAHVRRISYYTDALCREMGKDEAYCKTMFYASTLHDIGKIGVPDNILFKEGSLNDMEWEVMRKHPQMGGKMLSISNSPFIRMGREIAQNHHERWDGSGYPKGLEMHDIPLSARIMCICDVYDALRSKRPYKKAFDHQTAMNIILEGDERTSPKHFDPMVRAAFERCTDEFELIFDRHVLSEEV